MLRLSHLTVSVQTCLTVAVYQCGILSTHTHTHRASPSILPASTAGPLHQWALLPIPGPPPTAAGHGCSLTHCTIVWVRILQCYKLLTILRKARLVWPYSIELRHRRKQFHADPRIGHPAASRDSIPSRPPPPQSARERARASSRHQLPIRNIPNSPSSFTSAADAMPGPPRRGKPQIRSPLRTGRAEGRSRDPPHTAVPVVLFHKRPALHEEVIW